MANRTDFPSNSITREGPKDDIPERVEGVVESKPKSKIRATLAKRTFGDKVAGVFVNDTTRDVGNSILYDILIHNSKNLLYDSIESTLRMVFDTAVDLLSQKIFGDLSGTRTYGGSYRSTTRTRYDKVGKPSYSYYDDDPRKPIEARRTSKGRGVDFERYHFTKREAEDVLTDLKIHIEEYGSVTVAYFLELIDQPNSTYTDEYIGWSDLTRARIAQARAAGKYFLDMPRVERLD